MTAGLVAGQFLIYGEIKHGEHYTFIHLVKHILTQFLSHGRASWIRDT